MMVAMGFFKMLNVCLLRIQDVKVVALYGQTLRGCRLKKSNVTFYLMFSVFPSFN